MSIEVGMRYTLEEYKNLATADRDRNIDDSTKFIYQTSFFFEGKSFFQSFTT